MPLDNCCKGITFIIELFLGNNAIHQKRKLKCLDVTFIPFFIQNILILWTKQLNAVKGLDLVLLSLMEMVMLS